MNQRIRIVFVIPSLIRGGAERQLVHLFRGLDRSVYQPMMVVFNTNVPTAYRIEESDGQLRSLAIPAGGNFRAKNAPKLLVGTLRLAGILRSFRPQIVHAVLPAACVISSLACRLAGVPALFVGRRSMAGLHRRSSRILEFFDRLPLRSAAGLIGNCDAIVREAIELDRLSPGRAFMVHNGLDTQLFHPARNTNLRAEHGFADEHVVFGTIANFAPSKRHVDVVRAAAQIHARAPHARFLLAGNDYGTLSEVKALISSEKLESVVKIAGPTDRPQDYYQALDVYISSSDVEGLSNSILEAMATGLPVIATRVGGNEELVRDGQNGFLIPKHSPEKLAEAAIAILEDRSLRTRMGICGLENARTRFSIEAMVQGHERIYRGVLSRLGLVGD